jgi:hypothetical protein
VAKVGPDGSVGGEGWVVGQRRLPREGRRARDRPHCFSSGVTREP